MKMGEFEVIMVMDFGAGLTIDELIGLNAEDIASLKLPNERAYFQLKSAALTLCERDFGTYRLMELWSSGESVWMGRGPSDMIQVLPSGQIHSKDG